MPRTRATVDFGQFKKLAKQFETLTTEEIQEFNVKVVKELAARLLAKVKERTPVGQYDNSVNFTTTDGEKVSFQTKTRMVGGTLRKGWTIGNVTKDGNNYSVEIINPVEYSVYVEKVHRIMGGEDRKTMVGWREGVFMLKISEEELKKDAERIVENKLKQFIDDMLPSF